jgi:hypothetical protein
MTQAQKVCRFLSVVATLLVCVALLDSFAVIHQGEERHPIGFSIIWAARLGTLGYAVAIGLAAVAPKTALKLLWVSTVATAPLVAMITFPSLWCLFLECGPDSREFIWEPGVLVLFAAQMVALGGMHLSKPQ